MVVAQLEDGWMDKQTAFLPYLFLFFLRLGIAFRLVPTVDSETDITNPTVCILRNSTRLLHINIYLYKPLLLCFFLHNPITLQLSLSLSKNHLLCIFSQFSSMAYSGIMITMLASTLIATSIAQSPSHSPFHPPTMPPQPAAIHAPTTSPSSVTPPPSHSPSSVTPPPAFAPASTPSYVQSPAVSQAPGTPSPSSIANPPGSSETFGPSPNAAVSERFALGTFAAGLLVISLVA